MQSTAANGTYLKPTAYEAANGVVVADPEVQMSAGSIRQADTYNYDTLVGGHMDSTMEAMEGGASTSCCEVICGRPSADEPKFNFFLCRVSKRVVKNFIMILAVLLLYCFFLSFIMGKGSRSSTQSQASN